MEKTPFESLRIYQETLEIIKLVCVLCKKFPREEMFALTDQLKRAITSILLNIAESQGRFTNKDKISFLMNSRGSIYEVMAILDIAYSQEFMNEKDKILIREKLFSILKQLNNLITYYRDH